MTYRAVMLALYGGLMCLAVPAMATLAVLLPMLVRQRRCPACGRHYDARHHDGCPRCGRLTVPGFPVDP